jgi:hypothetical protein
LLEMFCSAGFTKDTLISGSLLHANWLKRLSLCI